MLIGLLVCVSAFSTVFLLGMNSKMIRDDKILAAAIISWLITCAQYAMTWAVIHAGLGTMEYILWAGVGGCTGITLSQYCYKWWKI
tara:strand:- start:5 stop:262 length:258 start_codon:yes stop_codon:yes gene_type:complete